MRYLGLLSWKSWRFLRIKISSEFSVTRFLSFWQQALWSLESGQDSLKLFKIPSFTFSPGLSVLIYSHFKSIYSDNRFRCTVNRTFYRANPSTPKHFIKQFFSVPIVSYEVLDGGSYKKFKKKMIFVTFLGMYWVWGGGVWGYCGVNAWIIHSRWVKYDS